MGTAFSQSNSVVETLLVVIWSTRHRRGELFNLFWGQRNRTTTQASMPNFNPRCS